MPDEQSPEDAFAAITAALLREPEVDEGTGFGSSGGLRTEGRIFATLTAGELVVKLPAIRVAELLETDGVRSFVVGRRTMREWVCVSRAHTTGRHSPARRSSTCAEHRRGDDAVRVGRRRAGLRLGLGRGAALPAVAAGVVRTLTRPPLTAAHAARQLLIERAPLAPAEAIRRLTPLQAQDPPAPYVALAARVEGFARDDLEAAIASREVVKTTINRLTLHLVGGERPGLPAAHAPGADARVAQDLRPPRRGRPCRRARRVAARAAHQRRDPRAGAHVRGRHRRGLDADHLRAHPAGARAAAARGLLARPRAAELRRRSAPAARACRRGRARPRRYLAAFGPASRRDVASWAGVAQRDFAAALERLETVSYRDERGAELLDLPGQPLPPAVDAAAGALPVALGPGAARLRRPRADRAARGPAAEAHAVGRPDRDGRRPRRRELEARALDARRSRSRSRRTSRSAARRAPRSAARRSAPRRSACPRRPRSTSPACRRRPAARAAFYTRR